MPFQLISEDIKWKIHLQSPPNKVFQFIASDIGRGKFWAKTNEYKDVIEFLFPNSYVWKAEILIKEPPTQFSIKYIDNSITTFKLATDNVGGTDLTLQDKDVKPEYRIEVIAGWGSVLMALKAAVDFGIDLRNHDPSRTWDQGYFDN